MAKRSKMIFTNDENAPEKARAAISIPTGKRKVTVIPLLSEGNVSSLFVKQASGTDVEFSVDLLDSSVPYGDGTGTPEDYDAPPVMEPGLFWIMKTKTAPAGGTIFVNNENSDRLMPEFVNSDQITNTDNIRKIYLLITPENSVDTTTWDVSILLYNQTP